MRRDAEAPDLEAGEQQDGCGPFFTPDPEVQFAARLVAANARSQGSVLARCTGACTCGGGCNRDDDRTDAQLAGRQVYADAELLFGSTRRVPAPQQLIALQRAAGNRAVGRLLARERRERAARLLARQHREQRPATGAAEQATTAKLIDEFEQAVAEGRWDDAAAAKEPLSYEDAVLLLGELSYAQLQRLGAAMQRTGNMAPSGAWADAVKGKAVSESAWTDKKMGTWGFSNPEDIIGAKRHEQIYDTFEGAIAYAQSLGHPAGVVADREEFAVYDLNPALSRSVYPFSLSNVKLQGARTNVRAVEGVRAFVTTDGAAIVPGGIYGDDLVVRDHVDDTHGPFEGHIEAFGSGLSQITDQAKFLSQFEKAMRDTGFWLLDIAGKETLAKQAAFKEGMPLEDGQKIRQVTDDVAAKDREVAAANAELSQASAALSPYQPQQPGDVRVKSGYDGQGGSTRGVDIGALEARQQAARDKIQKLTAERRQIFRTYPMLLYIDEKIGMAAFAALDDKGRAKVLNKQSIEIGTMIDASRGLIRESVDLSPYSPFHLDLWSLPNLVNATAAGLGVTDDTHRKWIEERVAKSVWVKTVNDVVFAALAIGLGAVATFASGGLALAAGLGLLAVSTIDALRTTDQYLTTSTLTHTAIDPEQSLLSPEEELHWGWVVAAWIGVGLDFLSAMHAAKALARGAEVATVADEAAKTGGKVTKDALLDAAKTNSSVWQGINPQTETALHARPALVAALQENPLAASMLKLCASVCYRVFATRAQIQRLDKALRLAAANQVFIETDAVRLAIHNTNTAAELDRVIELIEDGIKSQIGKASRAGQVAQEFDEAGKIVDPAHHIPGSGIDEGFYLTERLRRVAGVAKGGEHLPVTPAGGRLLLDGRVGPIPGQIAAKLRGMHFNDFADFRSAFWRLVADDPVLGQGWSAANKARMRNGLAPFAGSGGTGGGSNALLQLNHKQALKNAGALYDVDNIEIVTPWFHQRIGI